MEVLALGQQAAVEAKYRVLEAERARQERATQRESGARPTEPPEDALDAACSAEKLMEEMAQAARARRASLPVSLARKKEEVIRGILWRLYSCEDEQDAAAVDERALDGRQAAAVSLSELDTATQVSLRMLFRLCSSIRDPARLPANAKLVVQIAQRVPGILARLPPCLLSPGFKDEADSNTLESSRSLSVFWELLELFSAALELSGVTSEGASEGRCLSTSDQATVVTAYLALSLKLGRLRSILVALRYLLESDHDAFTTTHIKQLEPLFEGLASTHADPPHIATDQDNSVSGFIMSFGKGDHGKLGHGQCAHVGCQEGNCTENKAVPTMIEAARGIKFAKVDSLSTHSIGITTNGEVMAWGNGDKYRLGHGSTAKEYVPKVVELLSSKGRVRDVSCGLGHTIALTESGEMYAWGNGSNGRLGLGDVLDRSNPTLISATTIVSSGRSSSRRADTSRAGVPHLRNIYCGASHSMAISYDGQVFTWGKNNQGQCGHGHTNDQLVVQEVAFFGEEIEGVVTQAAGGWEHSLFCTTLGRVYACGCGYKDSRRTGVPPVLGLGDLDRRVKPALLLALAEAKEDIIKVACGWDHSIAISSSGQVFTWGSGTNGKLGHGDEENCELPTLVRDLEGKMVVDAKGGCEHTILLTANHEIWSFGHGDSGRLGHGDNLTKKSPARIDQFTQSKLKPVAIAAGDKYNLILVDEREAQTHESHELGEHKSNGGDDYHHQRTDLCTDNQSPVYTELESETTGFQANWVLEVAAQIGRTDEPAERSETDGCFFPTSAKQMLLFVLGHIDRIAVEYLNSGFRGPTHKRKNYTGQSNNNIKIAPFAIDTSLEVLEAIAEMLRWSFSRPNCLVTIDTSDKSNYSRMTNERIAAALSLLRILRLNLPRDVPNEYTSQDTVFLQLHRILLQAGDVEVDQPCTPCRRELRDSQIKALQFEAALVIQSGYPIFYSTGEAQTGLLVDIVESLPCKKSHVRTMILAQYLLQDKIMRSIFKLFLNSEGGTSATLQSTIQNLLVHCVGGDAFSKTQSSLNVEIAKWPHQLLYIMYTHVLGHLVLLLSSDADQHAQINGERIFLDSIQAFAEQAFVTVKEIHHAYLHSDSMALLNDPRCALILGVAQSVSVVLRSISDGKLHATTMFKLSVIERVFPSLFATAPLVDEIQWKLHHRDEKENKEMPKVEAFDIWTQSMCSTYGLLVGILLHELVNMSTVQFSSHQDEFPAIQGIIQRISSGLTDKADVPDQGTNANNTAVQLPDKDAIRKAMFTTGVCIANTALKRFVTHHVRCPVLCEMAECLSTNTWAEIGNDESFWGLETTQALSFYYGTCADIVNRADTVPDEVNEALRVWLIPLSTFKIANENTCEIIANSYIIEALSRTLCNTTQAENSCTRDLSNSLMKASLPLKLKPALFTALNHNAKTGTISAIWEALSCIGLQLGKSIYTQQLGPTLLFCKPKQSNIALHAEHFPKTAEDLSQRIASSAAKESVGALMTTLFALLSTLYDEQERLSGVFRQLSSLVVPSACTDENDYVQQWREQIKVFVLGNPVLGLTSRRHAIGLTKSTASMHMISRVTTTPRPSEATNSLTVAFWMFVSDIRNNASSTDVPSNVVESNPAQNALPTERVSLLAVGGASFQLPDDVISLPSLDSMKSIGVIVAVKLASFSTTTLELAISTTKGIDVEWKCEIIADNLATGKWHHIALVCAYQQPIQIHINGELATTLGTGFDLAQDFFHEASNWSTIHTGGQLDNPTMTPMEVPDDNLKSKAKPSAVLVTALDDVWIGSQCVPPMLIKSLATGGSTLRQSHRQAVLEKQCYDIIRLINVLTISPSMEKSSLVNKIDPDSVSVSDDWVKLLIRVRCKCFHSTHPVIPIYICEMLAKLLPQAPNAMSIDLSELAEACFRPFCLAKRNRDTSPLALLSKLENDSRHQLGDTTIFSKRHEILQMILHQFEFSKCQSDTGVQKELLCDGSGDRDDARNQKVRVYMSSIRLFQNLAGSQRWKSWFVQLLQSAADRSDFLSIAISILSGCPGHLTGKLSVRALNGVVDATFDDWSSGMDVKAVEAIQHLAKQLLTSKGWNNMTPGQLHQFDGSNREQFLNEVANCVMRNNLRTRLIRFIMNQLRNGSQNAVRWASFLVRNPEITRFFLRVGSTGIESFVKQTLGVGESLSSYHDVNTRRVIEQVQDVKRWNCHSQILVTQLESLQWKAWEAARMTPVHTTVQSLILPNHLVALQSPLEAVAGCVELCGLQVFACEGFPTVKLPTISITTNSGLWFYEAILLTDGLMQIGFLDGDFVADPSQGQGVGDHTNSWAFDGYRSKKWNVSSQDYGARWQENDVVGVLLDTDRMEISFFINGEFLGVAFAAPPTSPNAILSPAASLSVCQAVQFVIGPPLSTLANTQSFEEAQTVYRSAFKHWPQLGSLQDQQRMKPVVVATEEYVLQASRNADNQFLELQPSVRDNCGGNGDATETNDDAIFTAIARPYQNNNEQVGVENVLCEDETTSNPLLHGSTEQQIKISADSTIETSAQRHHGVIERLNAIGIPLESLSSANTLDWGLEGINALGRMGDESEQRICDNTATPLSLLSGVGSKHEDCSASSLLDVSSLTETILAQQLSSSATEVETSGDRTSISNLVKVDDEIPSSVAITDYFADAQVCANDVREALEVMVFQNSTTPSSKSREDICPGVVPVCVGTDATLCVLYCRHLVQSLLCLSNDQSSNFSDLYEIVSKWMHEATGFMDFLRIAIGVHPSEPITVASGDEPNNGPLQLEASMHKLLCIELDKAQTCGACDSVDAIALRMPFFFSLFKTVQHQCQSIVTDSEQLGSSSLFSNAGYGGAWFAWTSGVLLAFVEAAVKCIHQESAIAGSCAASAFTATCFSPSFLSQITRVALGSVPKSVFKYVAQNRLAQICRVLGRCVHDRLMPHGIVPITSPIDLQKPAQHLVDILPIDGLIELLARRWRREKEASVYASGLTTTLFDLLVHMPGYLYTFQCWRLESGNKTSGLIKLLVGNVSPNSVVLSCEWKQELSTDESVICDASNSAPSLAEERVISIHLEEYTSTANEDQPYFSQSKFLSQVCTCPGSIKLHGLASDTMYRVRAVSVEEKQPLPTSFAETEGCIPAASTNKPVCDSVLDELIIQTPLEPMFELDRLSAGKNLSVLNQNLTVKNAINKKWHSVRSNVGFDEGVHEWQVRIDVCVSKNIFIGVCTAHASMENYIGSDAHGYGFLANKAVWFNKTKLHTYGEIFKQGDIIQVTLDCNAKTLAFSRNGDFLGIAATNVKAGGAGKSGTSTEVVSNKWYPAFSLYNKDDQLTFMPPSSLTRQSGSIRGAAVTQHASVVSVLESAHCFFAYDSECHLGDHESYRVTTQNFINAAAAYFNGWQAGSMTLREIELGRVVLLNTSRKATEPFGLHCGDMVFTADGQCTVLGVCNHLLWYEKDVNDRYGPFEKLGIDDTTALASWSLSACQEMLKRCEDFPIHRQSKEDDTCALGGNDISISDFQQCQQLWNTDHDATTWDTTIINSLDIFAEKLGVASPFELSFEDATREWSTKQNCLNFQRHVALCPTGQSTPERCLLARVAFLTILNMNAYALSRIVLRKNGYMRSFQALSKEKVSDENSLESKNTHESQSEREIDLLSAALHSPLLSINSGSSWSSKSLTSLLFRSQKERLISEELACTKTATSVTILSEAEQDSNEISSTSKPTDLRNINITYPNAPFGTPFWELNKTEQSQSRKRFNDCLPGRNAASSIFMQLVNEMCGRGPSEWRREVFRSLNVIPIRQAFAVFVTNPEEANRYFGFDNVQTLKSADVDQENEECNALCYPVDKTEPCLEYLQVLECAVREVQSPQLPMFVPVSHLASDNCQCSDIVLDVNTCLLAACDSSTKSGYCSTSRSEVLKCFFALGQIMGIAWRSKVILPLQFLSIAVWEEIIDPDQQSIDAVCSKKQQTHIKARQTAIDAIRSGLLSIIPSRCLSLCGAGLNLRSRISDLDVNFVSSLKTRASFSKDCKIHRMFWKVADRLSSTERGLFARFLVAGRTIQASEVVLHLTEADANGREGPDTSFPVIYVIDECTRRLHLPKYSSSTALRTKLALAMTNTQEL